jgi:predicted dehydrogenase
MNWAVVGCGMLARGTHIPNLAKSPNANLHTCCDLDEASLKICTEKFGAEKTTSNFLDAINDDEVDAILLATTERLRLPAIEAAAKAGKPVYTEKPLARSLKEVYEIQKVVNRSGIPFCVGHNRRSSPCMLEGHRIFREHMDDPKPCPWRWDREGENRAQLEDNGRAGMSVRINDDWYSWKGWVFDKEQAPHGPMLFEMTHFTDLCNWFLAAEPAEVVALETGMLNHGIVIRYETGEMATLAMCANGTFGYPKELYEMFGNGAAVVVDHMLEIRTAGIVGVDTRIPFPLGGNPRPDVGKEGGLYGWLAKKKDACEEASAKGDPQISMRSGGPDKGHAHALERFMKQILGEGPEVCGVNDAVKATEVAFAAIHAAHEKRAVAIEEVRNLDM